jgi:hypothetical protein
MGAPTFSQALEQAELLARQALPHVCHERIACAVALVKNGSVLQLDDATWEVQSATTEGQTYHINGTGCPCEDAKYKAPKKLCKHQLGVQLFRKAVALMHPPAAPVEPPRHHTSTESVEAPLRRERMAPALPEAPASVNFRAMIGQFEMQFTLRDASEAVLLQRLAALLKNKDIRPIPKPAPRPQGQWKQRKYQGA